MKLIKAYIRTNMIDKVIHALEAGGFTDMTLVDVEAIRIGIDPKDLDFSVEIAELYMNVAKLEIVLEDEHVEGRHEVEVARHAPRGLHRDEHELEGDGRCQDPRRPAQPARTGPEPCDDPREHGPRHGDARAKLRGLRPGRHPCHVA